MSGQDSLSSYSTKFEGWVSTGQTLDEALLSVSLQCTASNDPPFLEDSTLARLYRDGTEMGLWVFTPLYMTSTPQTGHSKGGV